MSTSQLPTESGQFEPSQQNNQPQQYTPQPPKKRSRRNLWITIGAIILLVFAIVGIKQFTSYTPTATPTATLSQADQSATAQANAAHITETEIAFQATAVAVSNSWITATPTQTQAQIESDYKAHAVSATVASLDKDGSADTGKIVHFTGTILDFAKDSSGNTAGANVTTSDTSSVIQVGFSSSTDITRLNQDDTVEVWGTDNGTFSGKNAYGGTVQEVGISAAYLFDQTTNYKADK